MFPKGKDRYETEKAYEERRKAAYKGKSIGIFSHDDIFVFAEEPTSDELKYNPSREGYELSVPSGISIMEQKNLGTYVAQNAFGVTVEILKRI